MDCFALFRRLHASGDTPFVKGKVYIFFPYGGHKLFFQEAYVIVTIIPPLWVFILNLKFKK